MQNLYTRIRNYFNLPKKSELNSVFASFSKKEWHVFTGLLVVLIISTLLILQTINKSFMVEVPMRGGSISEGIVGTPRFINPILANTSADADMVELIYSGLMRKTGEGGLIPDLAEKYEVSKNGLVYTFTLKDDLFFHDGKPVTVDDILFTIDKVKESTQVRLGRSERAKDRRQNHRIHFEATLRFIFRKYHARHHADASMERFSGGIKYIKYLPCRLRTIYDKQDKPAIFGSDRFV